MPSRCETISLLFVFSTTTTLFHIVLYPWLTLMYCVKIERFERIKVCKNCLAETGCRCQNRRISGRGSRTVRLRSMVTGDWGHDVYPGSVPLYGGNTLLLA